MYGANPGHIKLRIKLRERNLSIIAVKFVLTKDPIFGTYLKAPLLETLEMHALHLSKCAHMSSLLI